MRGTAALRQQRRDLLDLCALAYEDDLAATSSLGVSEVEEDGCLAAARQSKASEVPQMNR